MVEKIDINLIDTFKYVFTKKKQMFKSTKL